MIRAMKLNYQKHSQHQNSDSLGVQTLSAPMIILPGLFGSTRNWRSFATELSKVGDVYVVDQRNHGDSPHAGSHTYADMAADLVEFIDYLGVEAVHLIGHSMGGKASMCCALWYPKRLLSLTVLDIAPVVYEHSHAPPFGLPLFAPLPAPLAPRPLPFFPLPLALPPRPREAVDVAQDPGGGGP